MAEMRQFDSGATRNIDVDKLDYEGFYHPSVMKAFAEYMHKNRLQADGKLRDSDNWQKGIPRDAYMKSMYRHFFDVWSNHRGEPTEDDIITSLCALLFNVQGMLFEVIRDERVKGIPVQYEIEFPIPDDGQPCCGEPNRNPSTCDKKCLKQL